MKNIILISSWLDDITKRRQKIMSESPYLKDYKITHVFASQNPYGTVIPDTFYENLKVNLNENATELVLVHTGASFYQHPNEYIEALIRVRKDFPNLKFGVERGRIDDKDLDEIGIFDNVEEVRKIEELFFKVAYGLI